MTRHLPEYPAQIKLEDGTVGTAMIRGTVQSVVGIYVTVKYTDKNGKQCSKHGRVAEEQL